MQQDKPHIAIRVFASGLGTGYSPSASGTVGSAAALLLYWFIPGFSEPIPLLIASAVCLVIGIPASAMMEKHYGQDPSEVVIDEFVGMWLALVFLPKAYWIAVAAFFLFRFFDIIKIPPAKQFDNMKGGTGIMLDDVAAGIWANVLLQGALFIEPLERILLS